MDERVINKTAIFVLFSVVLLLVMPLAAAYKTDITVKTKPNMLVSINIDDPVSDDKLLYKFERADNSGIFSTNFSTGLKEINIRIKSIDSQNIIIGSREFLNYPTGEPINLNFVEEEKAQVNETETQANETIEETAEEPEEQVGEIEGNKTGVTGLVFSTFKENFSKTIYYIIGIVFLIGVIMFFVISRKRLMGKGEKEIRIKKLSELQKEEAEKEEEYEPQELKEVERKIREAQEEIEKIKNKEGKIKQAEKRFEEAKRELERLRGEDRF